MEFDDLSGSDNAQLGSISRVGVGPAEVQCDAMGVGPQVQVPGYELGALIDPNRLRIAQPTASPLQGLDDVFRPVGEPGIDDRQHQLADDDDRREGFADHRQGCEPGRLATLSGNNSMLWG